MMISMLGFALFLMGQASPASAESAPADIIVTAAKPPTPKEARHFVRSISIESDGQLARFGDPVCPRVLGLEESAARVMEGRFRMVAQEAGILVGSANCRPNALMVFVEDGHALIEELYHKQPGWLGGLTSYEIARLREASGPVRIWRSISLQNEDGQTQHGGILRVLSGSVINPQTQQAIDGAVLVFDNSATLGKTVRQLADYAALRLLAKTRPPAAAGETATILSLFDQADSAAPIMMTSIDQQYLRALYKGPGNRSAGVKKNDIARNVARAPRQSP
ncbi:hypothetical protein [Sphingomonas sp. 28-63-12]|uniref:hypothetical protein n=1 Tax=Sphingomonas sp. 28-63-12 TaxID=1970434 RepID=UPI0035A870E0